MARTSSSRAQRGDPSRPHTRGLPPPGTMDCRAALAMTQMAQRGAPQPAKPRRAQPPVACRTGAVGTDCGHAALQRAAPPAGDDLVTGPIDCSALDAFVELIGARAWSERLAAIRSWSTGGSRAGRALLQYHAVEIAIERLRARQ